MNTYIVAKAVADSGTKVVLSGLGGDELFGGYRSFRMAAAACIGGLQACWDLIPGFVRGFAPGGKRMRRSQRAQAPHSATGISPCAPSGRCNELQRHGSISGRWAAERTVCEVRRREVCRCRPRSVNWNSVTTCANVLLRDADTMSMAHSVETARSISRFRTG